jgi:hypothetical protein
VGPGPRVSHGAMNCTTAEQCALLQVVVELLLDLVIRHCGAGRGVLPLLGAKVMWREGRRWPGPGRCR